MMDIKRDAFTENLGSDWIAVDAQGNVLCRSSTEDGARRARPNAEYYLTGAHLDGPEIEDPIEAEEPVDEDAFDEEAFEEDKAIDAMIAEDAAKEAADAKAIDAMIAEDKAAKAAKAKAAEAEEPVAKRRNRKKASQGE